jgi:hypothetical protein
MQANLLTFLFDRRSKLPKRRQVLALQNANSDERPELFLARRMRTMVSVTYKPLLGLDQYAHQSPMRLRSGLCR